MAVAVKALFFDVFGTLVDWRTSIARETEALLKPLGFTLDWPAFADAWRGEYQGAMDEVRSGRIPFCKLDILHRRNLELILPRFHVGTLTEEQRRDLNLAWHRLDAWPDVPPGMARLKRKYMLAPVSNGNISLMVDLPPNECMMVAAHTKDLMAAAALGLRTGHIARPNEHGPGRGETAPGEKVDFAAKSLEDLAGQLGT